MFDDSDTHEYHQCQPSRRIVAMRPLKQSSLITATRSLLMVPSESMIMNNVPPRVRFRDYLPLRKQSSGFKMKRQMPSAVTITPLAIQALTSMIVPTYLRDVYPRRESS